MTRLFLDTNCFVYRIEGNDPHKGLVKQFLNTMLNSADELCISDEVSQELAVRNNGRDTRKLQYQKLLHAMRKVAYTGTREDEHSIRMFASYMVTKYGIRVPSGYGGGSERKAMKYPPASDARIILTALREESSRIVTADLDDFAVFLAFGRELIDPLTSSTISMPSSILKQLENDQVYLDVLRDLRL